MKMCLWAVCNCLFITQSGLLFTVWYYFNSKHMFYNACILSCSFLCLLWDLREMFQIKLILQEVFSKLWGDDTRQMQVTRKAQGCPAWFMPFNFGTMFGKHRAFLHSETDNFTALCSKSETRNIHGKKRESSLCFHAATEKRAQKCDRWSVVY